MSKRWDDWVTNTWDTLGYDRHDSPDSNMTVPLDPGVTYYPHENKWGLQMDSLDTDLDSLVERKKPQQLEELKKSTSTENVHHGVVLQPELVPLDLNQTALHTEQTSEQVYICCSYTTPTRCI